MNLTYKDVLEDLEAGKIKTGIEGTNKKAWLRYCYHFSHVENIISILKDGELLARSEAVRLDKMVSDNASEQIIELTNSKYKDFVRLYFRPKSPTQYHNEGFKTEQQLRISCLDAQCPVPVFLFFDLEKVLNHPESQFSEKSLASSNDVQLYNTPEEFRELPFAKIYHDRALSQSERDSIVGHRHAEIIIPDRFSIDEYLKRIVVRSPAEKETLLSLMDGDLKNKFNHLIQIDSTQNVFFNRWTYLYEVDLYSSGLELELRLSSETNNNEPIQFDLELAFEFDNGNTLFKKHTISDWTAVTKILFNFQNPKEAYQVRVRFDGHLMYSGRYEKEENLPY